MVTFYRRLPKFDYLSPRSISETLGLLVKYKGKTKIIAGGTDVIPKLKKRACPTPEYIIDLKNIPDLEYIKYEKIQGLKIGALTTIHAIETSPLIKDKFNILSQAAATMASTQVRNIGTIAGNICSAVPSADSIPALLTLGAKIKLVNQKGVRIINIENFFTGPGETVISDDEIMQEIQIPDVPQNSKGVYFKLSPRHSMDLAVVGVAVLLVMDKNLCQDIKIALGAVSPTPMRVKKAEIALKGKFPNAESIDLAARIAAEESRPISDHRASAEYRREMVEVLTRRAIIKALAGLHEVK